MTMTHDQLHTHGPDELATLRAECDKWHKAYDRVWEERMRFADRAIELEKENSNLKRDNEQLLLRADNWKSLCFAGEEKVDAVLAEKDAEIRRLKRALWLARAGEAAKEVNYWNCENESSYAIVDFNVHHETIVSYKAPHHRPYKWILIWENVERKCLNKAEEYK